MFVPQILFLLYSIHLNLYACIYDATHGWDSQARHHAQNIPISCQSFPFSPQAGIPTKQRAESREGIAMAW